MKKITLFLSALLVLSLLAGCNDQPIATVTTAPATTAAPQTTAPETTAPVTTAPPTTAAPETTAPVTTEPLNVYCDLPELTAATTPATLPENPALSDLVTTGYTGSACWEDLCGNIETPTFCLPSVTPFCEGAIAINREIVDIFAPILEQNRGYFDQKLSAFEVEVSYETWLNGDILSILITCDTHLDTHSYYAFSLDISTGSRLSEQDLVRLYTDLSYPEFLYHATYTVYDCLAAKYTLDEYFSALESNAMTMQAYQFYLGQDNTLMLCSGLVSPFLVPVDIPYDTGAHGIGFEADAAACHSWLFRLTPSSLTAGYLEPHYAAAWNALLADSFFFDPEGFVTHLSAEDAAIIQKVADGIAGSLTHEETEAYTAACQTIRDEGEAAISQTAQTLLDALTILVEPADTDFVRVADYIPDILTELRYATENNFTGKVIYDFSDAYLRYGTVKKLMQAQEELRQQGLTLKIWDAFRPTSAQYKLWEVCPDPTYVADPTNGFSSHSRGNTLDITLCHADGTGLKMPTGFDDFSALADRDYRDCDPKAAANAQLLESIMTKCGFSGYSGEWWHYSDSESYDVENTFIPA